MENGRDFTVVPRFQRFRRCVTICLGMTPGAICFAGVVYVTSVSGNYFCSPSGSIRENWLWRAFARITGFREELLFSKRMKSHGSTFAPGAFGRHSRGVTLKFGQRKRALVSPSL